jgi:hypothetical protein
VFSQKLDLLIARLAATAAASTGTCSSKAGTSPPAAAPPAEVDLHDLMYRFTLDTFSRIGFGVDPGCLTTPGKIPFAQAFDRAQVVRQWGWQKVCCLGLLMNRAIQEYGADTEHRVYTAGAGAKAGSSRGKHADSCRAATPKVDGSI